MIAPAELTMSGPRLFSRYLFWKKMQTMVAVREYRKAKTAMVTKNSAEDEQSPMRNTRSLLMPSHTGASKDTWYNLIHTERHRAQRKMESIVLFWEFYQRRSDDTGDSMSEFQHNANSSWYRLDAFTVTVCNPPQVVDGSTDSVTISAALFADMDPHTPTHIIFDFSKNYIMSHRPVVVRVQYATNLKVTTLLLSILTTACWLKHHLWIKENSPCRFPANSALPMTLMSHNALRIFHCTASLLSDVMMFDVEVTKHNKFSMWRTFSRLCTA